MATMLARYEDEVRRTERMRTLAHLGGGIAHQLRNSATGCGIALDLHAQECAAGENCESLDVAKRQLRLMEEYLQRFLRLGRAADSPSEEHVDMSALVDDLLPLVEPSARHVGVELRWFPRARSTTMVGSSDRLRQMVINLLLNAIEAASQGRAQSNAVAEVIVELADERPGRLQLSVADSGPGPAEAVREQLFEPFVTEKPDGVGLGLSVAREVAEQHGGTIHWRRVGARTCFTVSLPCQVNGHHDVGLVETSIETSGVFVPGYRALGEVSCRKS
jgi:signal transduction histidine kinase